jgi:glucan 1,3-beta-glucosidase
MAREVSFVTIHILPYWEDAPVPIEDAVPHVRDIYAKMQQVFPDKPILIGETGWPSEGRQRWGAIPSRVNEARFLREFFNFVAQSHLPYNVIEAFDQPWKRRLEGTVGGYWGIYDDTLQPKFPNLGAVVEDPHWRYGIYSGLAMAVLFPLLFWGWLFVKFTAGRRPLRVAGVIVLSLAGYAVGATLYAEWQQMLWANRDTLEWFITSVWSVFAWLTGLLIASVLAVWIDDRSSGPLCQPAAVGRIARTDNNGSRWLGVLRLVGLFGCAVVCVLLVADPRYRDFPSALFAPVVIGYALLTLIGRVSMQPLHTGIEEILLAAAIALSVPWIVWHEQWSNTSALRWAALCLVLAGSVLLGRSAARVP